MTCGEGDQVDLHLVFTWRSLLYSHFLTQPVWHTTVYICRQQIQEAESLRNLPIGTKLLAKPGFEAKPQGSNIYIHMQTHLKIKF